MHLIPQRGHEVLEAAPHQVAITGQVARHLRLRQAGQASHVTLAQPLSSDGVGDELPRTHRHIMPLGIGGVKCPGVPDTVTGGRATRSTSPPLRRRACFKVGRSGSKWVGARASAKTRTAPAFPSGPRHHEPWHDGQRADTPAAAASDHAPATDAVPGGGWPARTRATPPPLAAVLSIDMGTRLRAAPPAFMPGGIAVHGRS